MISLPPCSDLLMYRRTSPNPLPRTASGGVAPPDRWGLKQAGALALVILLTACAADAGDPDPHDAAPTGAEGAYVLEESVDITHVGRVGENATFGDYFSDTTLVFSGDRSDPAGGFGDFRVSLPVNITVEGCRDDTLNIEDIFGDNRFTWRRLGALGDDARAVGGAFTVDMPVRIRVAGSERVLVDLEDIFSDNFFTWTVDTADASGEQAAFGGGVGGAVRVEMPVSIEVADSEDVEVDVEDVFCDSEFDWTAGSRGATTQLGGPIAVGLELAVRVENSRRVNVNLEDTAGDLTVDYRAGRADTVGGPQAWRVPTAFTVVDSRDVNIDFEDQASDNVLNWRVEREGAAPVRLAGAVTVHSPATFRVRNSRGVKVNAEDFFGDNRTVWRGPFSAEARAGLEGAIAVTAPTTFDVDVSYDVNLDVEDTYGDNIYAWSPTGITEASALPTSVYAVTGDLTRAIAGGDSVVVEFANLNEGNRYLWGPEPE